MPQFYECAATESQCTYSSGLRKRHPGNVSTVVVILSILKFIEYFFSNFKHAHVLQLLGVCFDNNPNFLILELMEGGDLLSYLRSNRPTVVSCLYAYLLTYLCLNLERNGDICTLTPLTKVFFQSS